MKIYVAGSTKDRMKVRHVMQVIEDAGHELTFNWLGPEGEIRESWADSPQRAREIAQSELSGATECDVLVLVYHDKILGAAIETGMALAAGKPVILVGECRESVFWYLPGVMRAPHSKAMLDLLMGMEAQVA